MNKQAAQTEINKRLNEAAHIAFPPKPLPVQRLSCTCCGESFRGRQFHNQDTGYGMGPCCADWVLNRRPFGHDPVSLEEFERTYGKRGFHFAIERNQ